MKAKFIKSGYSIEELNSFTDGEVEISGLIDYAWAYVESDTIEALKTNRVILIEALKIKDRKYIRENWIIKEYRIIFYYTKILANLDSVATQRSESYYFLFKKVINS
jgi:hypothetical protein